MRNGLSAAAALSLVLATGSRPATVDDLMKLRAIVDAQIAPDGDHVAYVVSTPNLSTNEHDGALFVVGSGGGAATSIGGAVKIFNTPTPRPQLRWRPDGRAVALLGAVGGRPQVFSVPIGSGA